MGPVTSLIAPLASQELVRDTGAASELVKPKATHFSDLFEGLVASANQSGRYADGLSEAFAAGARDDIHGTMIAMSKADIELRLVNNVRNKITDAFYELWRMQI
jgi:flagellar hook-basal body complex protein FliE